MTPIQALSKIQQWNRERAYIASNEAQDVIDTLNAVFTSQLTLTQEEVEGGIDSRILWEWVVENAIRKAFNI